MNQARIQQSIEAFRHQRILILGDVMIDEYIWGSVTRISPEAPVPVVDIKHRTYTPGGAANTARNIVALGGQAMLAGVTGRDGAANQLRQALNEAGVRNCTLIEDRGRPTTKKSRLMAGTHQIARMDSEQRAPIDEEIENALLDEVKAAMDDATGCVLSDYAKGVVTPRVASRFIDMAQATGKPVVVDPKGTDFTRYCRCTVVTPNIPEAEGALGLHIDGDFSLLEAGSRLLALLDGSAVLITRGAEGMSLFVRKMTPLHLPAEARHVFDVTGAGDTVVSMLVLALASGTSLADAAWLANRAAAIVVSKVGTATVTPQELLTVHD